MSVRHGSTEVGACECLEWAARIFTSLPFQTRVQLMKLLTKGRTGDQLFTSAEMIAAVREIATLGNIDDKQIIQFIVILGSRDMRFINSLDHAIPLFAKTLLSLNMTLGRDPLGEVSHFIISTPCDPKTIIDKQRDGIRSMDNSLPQQDTPVLTLPLQGDELGYPFGLESESQPGLAPGPPPGLVFGPPPGLPPGLDATLGVAPRISPKEWLDRGLHDGRFGPPPTGDAPKPPPTSPPPTLARPRDIPPPPVEPPPVRPQLPKPSETTPPPPPRIANASVKPPSVVVQQQRLDLAGARQSGGASARGVATRGPGWDVPLGHRLSDDDYPKLPGTKTRSEGVSTHQGNNRK